MNAVIRVDSSLIIGTGHVMRCLTLADELQLRGYNVFFISRPYDGNIINLIESKGYETFRLRKYSNINSFNNSHCNHGNWLSVPYEQECKECEDILIKITGKIKSKIDIVVVDHYSLDKTWHTHVKKYCKVLLHIDDLADRDYQCDVLLDQNYYRDPESRYNGLINQKCMTLLGSKYSLIKKTFVLSRDSLLSYEERVFQKKIIIFFGGMDVDNQTEIALKGVLLNARPEYTFIVVVGANNPNIKRIRHLSKSFRNVELHVQIDNMQELMAQAFLFIGAVGATTWERCACKLPGIVCSLAENQVEVAEGLHELGSHTYLGKAQQLTFKDYASELSNQLNNFQLLSLQSDLSGELVDGLGVMRVADCLESLAIH